MMLGALAISIRQPRMSAAAHSERKVEPLDVARAYSVFFRLPEDRKFLYSGYLGWRVARDLLPQYGLEFEAVS